MRALALLLVVVLPACSELPMIETGTCGNGILEAREDCDNDRGLCDDQCRIRCQPDSGDCPPGYRCGVDALCRAASGRFEPEPTTTFPFPVLGFRVTDVDFDGYGDVVGLNPTALNVRYGDENGDLADIANVVTPQVLGFPAMTHLVDPFVDDVVLPTADGLVVYTGAFGIPSPRQFPLGGGAGENSMGRPDPFDGVEVDETIGLFGPAPGGGPLAFGVMTLTPRGPEYAAATVSLCGTPMAADQASWVQGGVTRYANANATFISFTYQGRHCVLMVYKPTSPVPAGTGTCALSQTDCKYDVVSVTGAGFPTLMTKPVFADLDGDGCPSVIARDSVLAPNTGLVELAGTGTYPSCTISSTPTELPTIVEPPSSELVAAVPLDPPVADLAAEALVTSYGIFGFTTAGSAVRALYISDRRMERAITGDIDSDGATDVVLTTSLPNFDIARRVDGDDAFLLVRRPTTGAVTRAVFGDFDGDQRNDVAYVENLGTAQRLSIAYGTSDGLSAGIPADVFSSVEFMAPMQVRDSTDPFDLVDDLIVIDLVIRAGDISPEITVLHGSPSRTMLSFYGPPLPVPGTPFVGVTAGRFVDQYTTQGESGEPVTLPSPDVDLVALQINLPDGQPGSGTATGIWVIPGLPGGRLGDAQGRSSSDGLPPRSTRLGICDAGASFEFCLTNAAYYSWPIASDSGESSRDIVLAIDYKQGGTSSILRLDPAAPQDLSIAPFPSLGDRGRSFALETIDIDRDGVLELVAGFTTTAPQLRDGHVAICRMLTSGDIERCVDVASEVIAEPDLECTDLMRARVEPVCSVENSDADGSPRRTLVAICNRGGISYGVPIGVSDGVFTGSLASAIVATEGSLALLQLGDVTGDAVDDLLGLDVTGGLATMNVFRQLPTYETNVCRRPE